MIIIFIVVTFYKLRLLFCIVRFGGEIVKQVKCVDESNIYTMVLTIKIAIILFVDIILYKDLPNHWTFLNGKGIINGLSIAVFFLLTTALIYIVWLVINMKYTFKASSLKVFWVIETLLFSLIISIPIFISKSYENEFKYLFLLLIISSVIEYGSKYGLLASIFSTSIILTSDMMFAPIVNGVNVYFEKDLVISGIFVFVAFILGYYVNIEKENNKRKDLKLNQLSSELKEQDKKRSHIEEMLLNNKICYDMLFENSQNAIIVHDDGRIIYVNESAVKLLGYDNALQLSGEYFYDCYYKDDRSMLKSKYLNIIKNKMLKNIQEETIVNRLGESIVVRNTSSYFIYEGKPAFLTFLLDISSEKQIEILKRDVEDNIRLLNETKEYNKLITDFFINISHELKTPINVIYIAIQTMAMYLDNYNTDNIYKCKGYLKMMKQNCFRLMRLINNLLDITKLDSGFLSFNAENGNIVAVVEDIALSVAPYFQSKNIEIIFDTDVEEKMTAFDHDKMERIILNLLSNAYKHTPAGGKIEITIKDSIDSINIYIKDNGEGIPKDKIDIIFERFRQANTSLSRENEGSGIGLNLVKSFVEMHRGKISVSSSEGEGTEFIIEFPVMELKENECKIKKFYESNIERINLEFSDIYDMYDNN